MKSHVVTAALLLIALLLYALGLGGGSAAALLAGAACEVAFWIRVVRATREAPPPVTSVRAP